jgi:hypothetical protein
MGHAAVVHDVGRFRGPWRNGAQTGNHEEFLDGAFGIIGMGWLTVGQQRTGRRLSSSDSGAEASIKWTKRA